MGSNMAECHPVAFRWPMKAKMNGAKLIHVDPRFTRTSAVADLHVPIRAGSDIAFLGGLINYVVHSDRWNKDPFFKDYTVHYTNLATIVNEDYKDAEDLDGVFSDAVAWTQHTYGVQIISCCALLSQLTGNMGRPGGGIMALRGHAAIQGSTDVPTLYHSIHGYMNAPSAVRPHDTLRDYVAAETPPTGYWANGPKWMVSYLKSVYGDTATPENDFGYDWHPKILGDHSHIACFAAMAEGKIKGAVIVGQNPATSLNGTATRRALRQLDWLVVKENWLTETATHWYLAPEVKSGETKIADIKTEIFFFPSTQIAEYDGSFTNTQRMLQWHSMAAKAPGDCRTDSWFYHNLAKRLKKAYANSKLPRDQGWNNVTWDFDPDAGEERS